MSEASARGAMRELEQANAALVKAILRAPSVRHGDSTNVVIPSAVLRRAQRAASAVGIL